MIKAHTQTVSPLNRIYTSTLAQSIPNAVRWMAANPVCSAYSVRIHFIIIFYIRWVQFRVLSMINNWIRLNGSSYSIVCTLALLIVLCASTTKTNRNEKRLMNYSITYCWEVRVGSGKWVISESYYGHCPLFFLHILMLLEWRRTQNWISNFPTDFNCIRHFAFNDFNFLS